MSNPTRVALVALSAFLAVLSTARPAIGGPPTPATNGNITGTVADSSSAEPLQGSAVLVERQGRLVAEAVTDQFGRFLVHNLAPATYTVRAQTVGFQTQSREVTVPQTGGVVTVAFRLAAIPISLESVVTTAQAPIAVDTRTGDQVFQQKDYHGAPTNTTSQILQQSIAGAARAPTGEVHIRGQHAEYTYFVDGVPVLSGISGSLNELFDPAVVNRIEFQTGGWDAEYGGKNAAIVNVQTRIPAGGLHAEASTYAGSFNTNGQTLNLSSNVGRWGWFLSGSRQATNMRQEPVVFDTTSLNPINFHNHGQDLFGFGKLQYLPGDRDALDLDLDWSRTNFAVPFDSLGGTLLNDHQRDLNGFVNLGWRHRFGDDAAGAESRGGELFSGLFYRHGSLSYMPSAQDEPSFIFFPDPTPYDLSESRSFNTYGLKLDYQWRLSHEWQFKVGTMSYVTRGHEDFVTTDADGNHGPASNSDLNGHDIGAYAQTAFAPAEWLELRTGVRYDAHNAPFAGTQHQVSPRVKLNLFLDPANTVYLYYGRLFIPTNVEDLRAITSAADSGVVALPTLPERDNFYEAGLIHRFPFGVVAKLSAYHKRSSPGIDDNTVPGSAIVTSVNLAQVRITGLESVLEIRPGGPLSGYLNFALNHAYGRGPITGGFFPTDVADVPGGWFDLDHDQRVSAVASAVYAPSRLYLSATGIYGSGLTNGADITQPVGTGLFSFNNAIHVDPSFIVNASAGYTLVVRNTVVRPQIYVDNIFNSHYLLKGAFFSGASVGRPRSLQLRINVGM